MQKEIIITEETQQQIQELSCRIFNIKHALQFYINYIEGQKMDCELISIGFLLREYFNNIKIIYDKLEQTLDII